MKPEPEVAVASTQGPSPVSYWMWSARVASGSVSTGVWKPPSSSRSVTEIMSADGTSW